MPSSGKPELGKRERAAVAATPSQNVNPVIASAAKQSMVATERKMDCFAALAMTANRKSKHTRPRSRRGTGRLVSHARAHRSPETEKQH
jgi:hypothetical protein